MANVINATSTGNGGLVSTGDDSGILNIQTNETTAITVDASQNVGIGTTSPAFTSANRHVLVTDGTTDSILGVMAGGTGQAYLQGTSSVTNLFTANANPLALGTNNVERARIDSSGNLGLGGSPENSTQRLYVQGNKSAEGANSNDGFIKFTGNTGVSQIQIMRIDSGNYSSAACAISMGRNSSTLRSINAGGTINASGADYAEYMTKCGDFTVTKGDVIGIDANGKLTNVFADAISFVVKSTDPSYVGADTWGVELDGDEFEKARQKVDRIAFAGQVPVNVTGATAGQYIIPVNDNGAIKGQAVINPTFEQYQIAVGKVIAIESDGRAKIIVKVA